MTSLLELPKDSPLGAVGCQRVYMSYDSIPLLAQGKRQDQTFFMILAEDLNSALVYLYAQVDEKHFQEFQSDPLAVNATYDLLASSSELWVVSFSFVEGETGLQVDTMYSCVTMEELPEKWLPIKQ